MTHMVIVLLLAASAVLLLDTMAAWNGHAGPAGAIRALAVSTLFSDLDHTPPTSPNPPPPVKPLVKSSDLILKHQSKPEDPSTTVLSFASLLPPRRDIDYRRWLHWMEQQKVVQAGGEFEPYPEEHRMFQILSIRSRQPSDGLPRLIWTYWDGKQADGVSDALVRAAIEGWRWYNPRWRVVVVYQDTVDDYVGVPKPINFQHWWMADTRKDWVRAAVLAEHGGVWMDAGMIVTMDLEWLMDMMGWASSEKEPEEPLEDKPGAKRAASRPKSRRNPSQKEAFAFYHEEYTLSPHIPVLASSVIASVAKGFFVTATFTEFNTAFGNFHANDKYLDYLRNVVGAQSYRAIFQNMQLESKFSIVAQKVLTLQHSPGLSTFPIPFLGRSSRGNPFHTVPVPVTLEAETQGPLKLLKECGYDDWEYAKRLLEPYNGPGGRVDTGSPAVLRPKLSPKPATNVTAPTPTGNETATVKGNQTIPTVSITRKIGNTDPLPPILLLRPHTLKVLREILERERTVEPPRNSIYGRYLARFINITSTHTAGSSKK
ncbi:hypothetical protein HDU96_009898 [Phlyctochytrium bullatum]|nr:hypothetical protein HDU96_009898 [Phlyctochytrium bullatum]